MTNAELLEIAGTFMHGPSWQGWLAFQLGVKEQTLSEYATEARPCSDFSKELRSIIRGHRRALALLDMMCKRHSEGR